MCNFFSAIITKSGDLLSAPEYTDSHEDLVAWFDLRDSGLMGAGGRDWARVEFTPPGDVADIGDVSKWLLSLDENATPEWWDADKARELCAARVERMIVRTDRKILVGGPWIILAGKIGKVMGRLKLASKEANLRGAYLSGANLSGANLSVANLHGANLSGAYLHAADLHGADLSGAYLHGADLRGAYLSGANLSGAYLHGADLHGADLSGAYLHGADLRGADLSGANLSGAYLHGADLHGADLSGANLSGANLLSSDPVPAGWVRNDDGVLFREEDSNVK